MTDARSLFWMGLVAVGFAAAWFLLVFISFSGDIRYEAEEPWAVGTAEDAFAYAGEGVRIIQGTAALRIDPNTSRGILEFDLLPNEALTALLDGGTPKRSIVLRMRLKQADAVWTSRIIHGDSAIGDSRLPETYVLYAGSGRFEILIDGVRQSTAWHGFWSIGNALRQLDGSIRDQGLVFSPLLRDQSGFSDPDRTELTLLIYDSPDSDAVVLHLVFPDVRAIER
ncbi:hypothetical protein KAR02_11595 [Candidatus Bipolaricaulota bacterium]|nr:hypothetical protein [Candidatus Bipolaricaulota bacterium]